MKRLITLSMWAIAGICFLVSCNDSSESNTEVSVSSAAVYSFSLERNDAIMANLDTVFFAIDLVNARIYNADSLPYGTRINALVPRIRIADAVGSVELTVSRPGKADTVYNYLTNSTDSIDFSNGPVMLKVITADGTATMNYAVSVNVHRLKSDSLVWDAAARRVLPSAFTMPTRQSTARTAAGLFCLTEAGGRHSIAFTSNPYGDNWDITETELPAGTLTETMTGAGDKLFVLVDDGIDDGNTALYASADGGRTWTDAHFRMNHIYGSYGGDVYGNAFGNGGYLLADTKNGLGGLLPHGMPVRLNSNPSYSTFPMALNEQLVIVGGVDAGGEDCGAWGFDGNSWAQLSGSFGGASMQPTLVSFYTFTINSALIPTEYPTMLAFGGRNADGTIDRTVYRSLDYGITWVKAPQEQQLPEDISLGYGAQAYVYDAILGPAAQSQKLWMPILAYAPSRAIRPIEEWTCPFIFVFGGHDASGATYNSIWRATLNRLTFKPIQ